TSELSIRLAGAELSLTLREWLNSGLLTLFFFVAALEVRREFDLGDLRERRRLVVPAVATLGGMAVPALIYLAITAGTPHVHGWGIVMATDTAFALGLLGLVGRRWAPRVRVFLLTVVIMDDVLALVVIALAYTSGVSLVYTGGASLRPLLGAAGASAIMVVLRAAGLLRGEVCFLLGGGLWLALLASGVPSTLAGVAVGLLTTAYAPSRLGMEQAAHL